MEKDAKFSDCNAYRYALWRIWDKTAPFAMFVGLNPSTADAVNDDPTIRRCIGYAKNWDYGGLCMVNLFAYKATKPEDMKRAKDPIGPENDYWITSLSKNAGIIVGGWGNHGDFQNRADQVISRLPNMKCLNQNKNGSPSHPLYQRRQLRPISMRI